MDIINRWTRAVMFSANVLSLRAAVIAAIEGDADLRGADLRDADLGDADLRGANLGGANLRGANLGDADLRAIRDDFFAIIDAAPSEVPALATALRDGKVDGSAYQGECACLVGTLANAKGCRYDALPGIPPNANRPAERWFLAIRPDMPASHPVVAITLGWIDDWIETQQVSAK